MQLIPSRLTGCESAAYSHRRVRNTSSDCATASPWEMNRLTPTPCRAPGGAVFAKYGSQCEVGAILSACIDHAHRRCTRDAIRETPMHAGEAVQVSLILCRLPAFPTSTLGSGPRARNNVGASRIPSSVQRRRRGLFCIISQPRTCRWKVSLRKPVELSPVIFWYKCSTR